MNINVTLLLQIVHFLCAYWILRRALLIPLAKTLEKKHREKISSLHCILRLEDSIKQHKEYKFDQLVLLQKEFYRQFPPIISWYDKATFAPIEIHPIVIEEADRDRLIAEICNEIVEKASYGL